MYNLTFVGAGPSTIGAILKLIDKEYKGKILIIEKGKSLNSRQPNEVLNGFAGAGCFSDSKLSSALDVGGVIPGLTKEKLDEYSSYILTKLSNFKANTLSPSPLKWDNISTFDTTGTGLKWDTHDTCHVGTDNGQAIYKEIEKFIALQPNIELLFETEVLDVANLGEDKYTLYLSNGQTIETNKLVLATGQKNNLPAKLIMKFNLTSTPRALQLGVRVVDELNDQYRDIIKANYDFKFVKSYTYGDIRVRVRTFCCNSGNAHVCAEKAPEGFTCFNGHAYKTPDPTNNTVNYGIICEVEGLEAYKEKINQIELMKKVNTISNWYEDNFTPNQTEPVPAKKLLEGFEHLRGYYPEEVIESLIDFTQELSKIIDLSKASHK